MRWRCADDIYRRAPFNMSPKGAICMHDIDSIHIILKESQNVSKRLKTSQNVSKVLDMSVKILQIQKFI